MGGLRKARRRSTSIRLGITVALAVAGSTVPAASTLAANEAVTAADNVFTPKTVTVNPGESVTWTAAAGSNPHNVKFEDGGLTEPWPARPGPWMASRVFTTAGLYRYYCEIHGGPGGVDMAGTVQVASPSASPPSGTPDPGTPGGSPGAGTPLESLSLLGKRFCTRRGRRCRRPGVRLAISLSRPARVTGTLKRRALNRRGRARGYGSLDFGTVDRGRRVLRFSRTRSGRRLARGRYALTVKAGDTSRVLRFVVVS